MTLVGDHSDRTPTTVRWWRRILGLAAAASALTLTLAACGGGSSPSTAAPAAASGSDAPSASAGASGTNRGAPATSGTIAAVAASRIEVQNTSTGQTTVTFSGSTKFTEEQKTTLAAVKAGECVTASSASSGSRASSAPSSGSIGRTITAQTVTITAAVNGSCPIGGFGGAGRSGSGTIPSGFARPSGTPSRSFPSGARGSAAFADRVSGKVESVSGSTILVQSSRRTSASASAATTTTDTVDVTSNTTFLKMVAASSKALAVGKCATAIGPSDTTGAVSATRIAITPATAQGCQTGLGRFGIGSSGQGSGSGG